MKLMIPPLLLTYYLSDSWQGPVLHKVIQMCSSTVCVNVAAANDPDPQ